MRLWLLERIGLVGTNEYRGFVVRAADADVARCEALVKAGMDDGPWLKPEQMGPREPWWGDPRRTTCIELDPGGPAGLILDSFQAGEPCGRGSQPVGPLPASAV